MKKTTFLFALFTIVLSSTNAQTVTIGKQIWMAKNLNVDVFRNGDHIPEVKTKEEWEKAGKNKQPAWCYNDNDPINGTKYGKLYNWFAVNDPRGLAPKGYHIPSDDDWRTLIDFLGGRDAAGKKMKSIFLALPGGSRDYNGVFNYIGEDGSWWSSTDGNTLNSYLCYLHYLNGDVFTSYGSKKEGISVRCLKD
jgi:uncharacterized protein (TIGR02145 family)